MLSLLFALAACALPRDQGLQSVDHWGISPHVRIGTADAVGVFLTTVWDISVGPSGQMYILQPKEQLIRLFDPSGTLLRTVGRRGGGPGEFSNPTRSGWKGDTLWVWDPFPGRFSYFTVDGSFLGSVRPTALPIEERAGPVRPHAMLADGSLLAAFSPRAPLVADGVVSDLPLLKLDRDGVLIDTLAFLSYRNSVLAIRDPERPSAGLFRPQPFSDATLHAVASDGKKIVLVDREAAAVRDEARYQVTALSPSGDTLFSRAYRYTPVQLSEELVQRWVKEVGEEALRARGPNVSNRREAQQRVRTALYRPEYHPPVTSVLAGRDGTVWVRREETLQDFVRWEVLSESGDLLAIVAIPRDTRVFRVDSEHIWGVERDSLDVSYVVVYRVSQEGVDR